MTTAMTGPEFRVSCEWLGLNLETAATRLGVAVRTAARWGYGHREVPEGVSQEVQAWLKRADEAVECYLQKLAESDERVLVIYRSDDELVAHLGLDVPASAHRAVAARVLERMPDLEIRYPD